MERQELVEPQVHLVRLVLQVRLALQVRVELLAHQGHLVQVEVVV